MANPGPSTTVTPNYVIDPQNAYRLIAWAKGVNLGAAGDTLMNSVTSGGNILPYQILTANSAQGTQVNVATATVGIYSAPAQGGTTVLTTAALTSQTTGTYTKQQAATNPNTMIQGATSLYVNVGTTVAGGLVDVYVYGYDLS